MKSLKENIKKKFSEINYFSLSPDEFEYLVFSIFKNEINAEGEFYGKYDKVVHSPKTRERGKDSTLHFQDVIVGVIQCKRFDKIFSFEDFIKEFLKFILYGIKDYLFNNQKSFDYYLVAPKGFSDEITKFTNKNSGRQVEKLEIILVKLLRDPILKELYSGENIKTIKSEVDKVMNWISIHPKQSIELDIWLNKDYNRNLIADTLKYSGFTDQPINSILKDFQNASNLLEICTNEIKNIPNSHIFRKEVKTLYEKVISELPENKKKSNIIVLAGDAGCGKTGIMKDLYLKLSDENIPVLAIKTDKYENLTSLDSLQSQLNLQDSIINQINTLTREFEKVVLLLDQIDAINYFQSSKTNAWITYRSLFHKLRSNDKLRIIISIRVFDLETDFDFKELGEFNKVIVQKLDKKDVSQLLKYKNIVFNNLPDSLQDLLLLPNNLDIFCKIDTSKLNFSELININALYNELWKQKVSSCPKVFRLNDNKCQKLIFNICENIYYQSNKLSISDEFFIDDFSEEISYLKSCGILVKHEGQLEFFHSKFFEFGLAKSFVNQKKLLLDYIQENNQLLEIRPILRTVLELQNGSFLRDFYNNCTQILINNEIRLHIKLLVIDALAFKHLVIDKDIEIVENIVFKNDFYRKYFLEKVIGQDWLSYFLSKNLLNELIQNNEINLCRWICSRYISTERIEIINFLKYQLTDFQDKSNFVLALLYDLKVWDNPLAFELFDEHYKDNVNDSLLFHIYEEVVTFNPEWVIQKFDVESKKRMIDDDNLSIDIQHKFEYQHRELFKKLFEQAPELTFQYSLRLIEDIIKSKSYNDNGSDLIHDYTFGTFRDSDKDNRSFIGMFSDFIKKQAELQSDIFKSFIRSHSKSKSLTILELLINGFVANPHSFSDDFFEFIIFFNKQKGFSFDDKIHYKIRRILSELFTEFNNYQKETTIQIILSTELYYAQDIHEYHGKKRHYLKLYGEAKYKYLSAIPINELRCFAEAQKIFKELQRKFGKVKDEKPRDFVLRGVPPPLKGNAYDKMSFKDWEKSFSIFNGEKPEDSFSDRGSFTEHARAFKQKVIQEPTKFVSFIEKLVSEFKVHQEYIIEGLNGLIDAKHSTSEVKPLFKMAMWKFTERNYILYATWMVRYFVNDNLIDEEILNFLGFHAQNHTDPEKDSDDENKLQHGINTVRGSIADKITFMNGYEAFETQIFNIAETLSNDNVSSVRVALVYHLHYLVHLNADRTINIFKKIIETNEPSILKAGLSCANKLSFDYYDDTLDYFEKAIQYENLQADVAKCLFYCWINGNEKAFPFLEFAMNTYYNSKKGVIDIIVENLVDSKTNSLSQKAYDMAVKYLNENDNEIAKEYSSGILRLKPNIFRIVQPFLIEFAKSEVAKLQPGYFYHYLVDCCNEYPSECLELVKDFDKYNKIGMSEGGYYDTEVIQIILNCYSKFSTSQLKSKLFAIELFEKAIIDEKFRYRAFEKLNRLD